MVATTAIRAGARRGSSAAALIPTGKPRAAPIPQATTPTAASHRVGARAKTSRPTRDKAAHRRSTSTRPHRSSRPVPSRRMPVIAVTKTANATAPTALDVPKPSTTARLTQSLAEPSVSAAASTTSPIRRVRDSPQALKAFAAPRTTRAASGCASWVPSGRKCRVANMTTAKLTGRAMPRMAITGTSSAAALDVPVIAHLGIALTVSFAVVMFATRHFLPEGTHDAHPDAARVVRGAAKAFNAWGESRTLLIGLVVLAAALTEGSANDWVSLAVVDGFGTSNAVGAGAPARIAVVSTIGYSAFLAGPPLLGMLAEQVGYRHALLAILAPVVVGLFVMHAARPLPGTALAGVVPLDPAAAPGLAAAADRTGQPDHN